MHELLIALVLIGVVVAPAVFAARSGIKATDNKHSRLLGHEYSHRESAWLDPNSTSFDTEHASQPVRATVPVEGIALFRPRH
jgi:hypothetical protein